MFESRREVISWLAAVVVVAIMGVLVFGAANNLSPFHRINKAQANSSFPPLKVAIVTYPATIGAFRPPRLTVHPGQHVIFTNASNTIHTATARNGGSFDSKDINTGRSWTLIAPTKTGTYPYYCVYHPGMIAKLIVK